MHKTNYLAQVTLMPSSS